MTKPQFRAVMLLTIAGLAVLMAFGLVYGDGNQDWAQAPDIFPGIKYVKVSVDTPRKMDINCVRIDTQMPGLQFSTTPRADEWVENTTETRRQTTRNFLREARNAGRRMVVAINANAFSPWPAPWNQETLTDLRGLAVSDSVVVSPGSGTASLIIDYDGKASMATTTASTDTRNIRTAVSGFGFCLTGGLFPWRVAKPYIPAPE